MARRRRRTTGEAVVETLVVLAASWSLNPQRSPRIDRAARTAYDVNMSSIEFETELHGQTVLAIPPDVVVRLPKSGRATVIVHIQNDPEDEEWS